MPTEAWSKARGAAGGFALGLAFVATCAQSATAEAPGAAPRAELRAAERVDTGSAFELELIVEGLDEGAPILVTATHEGAVVEVVQGRFERAHAKAGAGGALVFRIPALAKAPGTGVVVARVESFICAKFCRAVRLTETAAVHVASPR